MSVTSTFIPCTSSMPSTLSKTDQNFIEFARCLYKAKLVVQDLEEFSRMVEPALSLSSSTQDMSISTNDFIKYINRYLDESFTKLNHMCKVLLVVLQKLESSHPVKRERIDSFRYEVLHEWQKTIMIKQNLLLFIQKKAMINKGQEEEEEAEDSESSIEPSSITSS